MSDFSRRDFLGASAIGAAGGAVVESSGIKPGDLIVKQVKVYVVNDGNANGSDRLERIASVVTNSGIEGNYTLSNRYFYPNRSNLGWLEYAKNLLPGKGVIDFPELTSRWEPSKRRLGQLSYASAADNCMWGIMGKAAGLRVYRLLGACGDRVRAYAGSQHLRTANAFLADLQYAKGRGFTAYKIDPPWLNDSAVDHKLDIEVAKPVRNSAGDNYALLSDRAGGYTRDEALKAGRALDELGYISCEDPIPTDDVDGPVELAAKLDLPVTIGEFIFSPHNFANYTCRRAFDCLRFIVDNVGGITGGMNLARLAECFGMEYQPHHRASSRALATNSTMR
jgi:L-alanine-DL-glutamate epimerase-like enolase superfamily enzyme